MRIKGLPANRELRHRLNIEKDRTVKLRAEVERLRAVVEAAREVAACSGECVMTVAGCQTHNWCDPCEMAELRAALAALEAQDG